MKTIKLFGLPRSCSNIITTLIEKNLEGVLVFSNTYADGTASWKHSIRKKDFHNDKSDFNLLSVKNPLAWIPSWIDWSHRDKNWFSHIRPTRKLHEMLDDTTLYGVPLVCTWSKANRTWLENLTNIIIVRHEDLLSDSLVDHSLKRIADAVGAPRLQTQKVDRVVNPAQVIETRKFPYDYYLNHQYMSHYREEDVVRVLEHLDDEIVQAFGYKDLLDKITNGQYGDTK